MQRIEVRQFCVLVPMLSSDTPESSVVIHSNLKIIRCLTSNQTQRADKLYPSVRKKMMSASVRHHGHSMFDADKSDESSRPILIFDASENDISVHFIFEFIRCPTLDQTIRTDDTTSPLAPKNMTESSSCLGQQSCALATLLVHSRSYAVVR